MRVRHATRAAAVHHALQLRLAMPVMPTPRTFAQLCRHHGVWGEMQTSQGQPQDPMRQNEYKFVGMACGHTQMHGAGRKADVTRISRHLKGVSVQMVLSELGLE